MSIAEKFYTMEYGAAPEDPKEANQWLERHHRRFSEFIGGAWVPPASAEYTPTADPSTGDTLAGSRSRQYGGRQLRSLRGAQSSARMASPHRPRARPLSIRSRPSSPKAFAPPRRS